MFSNVGMTYKTSKTYGCVFGDLSSLKHTHLGQKNTLLGRRVGGIKTKMLKIFTYPGQFLQSRASILPIYTVGFKLPPYI